jgi:catechol 2,3-dioxygenase-like lactoylglutathione lyase family enzyme
VSVRLNHTIVWCQDKEKSATFLTEMLGLPRPEVFGPFLVVALVNGVSLDFHETGGPITSQHYAFLIGEEEFDQTFARISARQIDYWADPMLQRQGQINPADGGRGIYFHDPDGHLLEVITRPYGGGSGRITARPVAPRSAPRVRCRDFGAMAAPRNRPSDRPPPHPHRVPRPCVRCPSVVAP